MDTIDSTANNTISSSTRANKLSILINNIMANVSIAQDDIDKVIDLQIQLSGFMETLMEIEILMILSIL